MIRRLRVVLSVVVLVSGFTGSAARASELRGVVRAGENVDPLPALSVAVDAWICGKGGSTPDPRLVIGSDGALANAIVTIVDPPEAPPFDAAPSAVIDQLGCVFRPHVVLLAPGQELSVLNSDRLLHSFRTRSRKNPVLNKAQTHGTVIPVRFDQPEIIKVECGVHYWMSAVIAIASHAFTAVTSDDGAFAFSGLPVGTYTLELWHETLGVKRMTAPVSDDGRVVEIRWDAKPLP